jgi:hypothetical protein
MFPEIGDMRTDSKVPVSRMIGNLQNPLDCINSVGSLDPSRLGWLSTTKRLGEKSRT